jgi:hypothetical protein
VQPNPYQLGRCGIAPYFDVCETTRELLPDNQQVVARQAAYRSEAVTLASRCRREISQCRGKLPGVKGHDDHSDIGR